MNRVFIVAEIGCNHNGDKVLAKRMIDEAKKCGIDAVKFQAFKARELISKFAPKADYQKKTTGVAESQLEMTAKLELSYDELSELKEYAESLGLISFATPFDMDSIDYLESLGQTLWKIPSGKVTNLPYLERIGRIHQAKTVILSTGMATIQELKDAITILLQGAVDKQNLILLHCNTAYPTPDQDVNLLAINALKNNFPDISIGFSDHSEGYVAAIGAAVLGAVLIEKHFTLDKNMPGPDHKASATPEELRLLCDNVRRIKTMMGTGEKIVTPSERKNKIAARESIVARREICSGEIFSEENLTCKRPGNGISPMHWYDLLGKKAERDFVEDELIEANGLKWKK